MLRKVVLGSQNSGKLDEFQHMVHDLTLEIVPQNAFDTTAVAETGLTFVENALLKARHAAQVSNLPAIGDDSGLEVDALNGAPGIYSARFAGASADYQANMDKLLECLQSVPAQQRQARFQCVLVFLRHPKDPTPIICQGTWEGCIVEQSCGLEGFGYDPVFFVPEYQCAAAELPPMVKNRISHRGKAMQQLLALLQRMSA